MILCECRTRQVDEARAEYLRIIEKLKTHGAEGVILGCTEITMVVDPADSPLPVFDTARIHVVEALELLLDS